MSDDALIDQLPADFLEDALVRIAEKAVNDELTDSERVQLFRLALQISADEFHRIEEEFGTEGHPAVNPTVLLLLQQVALLTEGNEVELSKLTNPVTGEPFKIKEHDDGEGTD